MRSFLALLVLAACSSSGNSIGDDDTTIDAITGSNGSGGTNVVDDVTCGTQTSTYVAPDGSKIVVDNRIAYLPNIDPAVAIVESCGRKSVTNGVEPAACPTGWTCTTTGVPTPSGTPCTWVHGGTVIGGMFFVSCGSETRNYDTNGTLTSTTTITFTSVRVHH